MSSNMADSVEYKLFSVKGEDIVKYELLQKKWNWHIPLSLRKRGDNVYAQTQIPIFDKNNVYIDSYCEFSKSTVSAKEIGDMALAHLARFHELVVLNEEELYQLTGLSPEESTKRGNQERLAIMKAKDSEDLRRNYLGVTFEYELATKKYYLGLVFVYKEGRRYWNDSAPSTGEKGVLTFEPALEFTELPPAEVLGEMVLEAFSRSAQLAARKSSGVCPSKTITLLNEKELSITPPKERNFCDEDDCGVGEVYQLYSYQQSGSSDSAAEFYLGMAAELFQDPTSDYVRAKWEEEYGKADFFEMREVNHGIFTLRAEIRTKKEHRISYFLILDDDDVLDCTMLLHQPNRRKKLDEKLTESFEAFALGCRIE